MEKLRIGIIGTGGIAHAHMNSYRNIPEVEVVAGADIVPGKAKAFFENDYGMKDVQVFEDHRKLLELDLDGVSICTYNTSHAVCAVDSLLSGKHVLLEKPMCVTIDEAAEIRRAEKKSGKFVTVGFQPRYEPNMQLVRNIVSSGKLGKIYYVQTGGGRRRGIPGGTFIRKELAAVGALADIGCYALDMAMNSIGYPKPLTVSACATDHFGKNPKYSPDAANFTVDDFSAAFVRLEGGITLDFRMSWAMHMDTTGDTIFLGTEAGLKVKSPHPDSPWGGAWDGTVGPISIFHDEFGTLTNTPIPLRQMNGPGMFELKVRSFIDAIRSGGPAPIPTSQIIYNQAIIDGIIRSSAAGKEVEVIIPEI